MANYSPRCRARSARHKLSSLQIEFRVKHNFVPAPHAEALKFGFLWLRIPPLKAWMAFQYLRFRRTRQTFFCSLASRQDKHTHERLCIAASSGAFGLCGTTATRRCSRQQLMPWLLTIIDFWRKPISYELHLWVLKLELITSNKLMLHKAMHDCLQMLELSVTYCRNKSGLNVAAEDKGEACGVGYRRTWL